MERRIIEKYAELNKACNQYPPIQLSSIEDREGYVVRETPMHTSSSQEKDYAEDGFIEVFCKEIFAKYSKSYGKRFH